MRLKTSRGIVITWLWPLALAFSAGSSSGFAQEVLRVAPKLYEQELAPLLTSVEAAKKFTSPELEDKAPGITLLEQRIYRVDSGGLRVNARQILRKAKTEAGAHAVSEEIFSFRKHEQRFYLLRAETIQPDGTVQPVKDNAVLVQTPQRQAQYALYDDVTEVRVIFPNVKPGSLTHAIVVLEDVRARMPGEFTDILAWPSTWPIGRIQQIVDLPEDMAKRLQVFSVGAGVPAVVREPRHGGGVRLTALKEKIPPMRDEASPAPPDQFGPCLHLTTVADWKQVNQWYGGLLRDRDHLKPELVSKIEAWTKNETSRDGIIRILFDKAANDVRYTGLELGESDYQPHDCNEVWDNQYGDCKDKANLLVAFLRQKNIPAQLVLVNALSAGLVDRRTPDFRVFNHVVVAIPDDKGGYQFCDPTVERSRPGLLGSGVTDRDVFIVNETSGEWIHTPAQSGGRLAYDFDLNLKGTGEMAGWLSLNADGYHAAAQAGYFQKLDANEIRQALSEMLRSFFPGAELVDVVRPAPDANSERFTLKAYFVAPRGLTNGSGVQSLQFPGMNGFFASFGYSPERDTPLFLSRGIFAVSYAVTLPDGTTARELPAPFVIQTPAGPIRAEWVVGGSKCRAELQLETTHSLLGPADFAIYYAAVQSLRGWLANPALLALNAQPAASGTSMTLEDFPRMPTGDGQLNLVEKRYPATGNPDLRRNALEKTLQYFPNEKSTVFQASFLLGELDWTAGRKQEVLLRYQLLLTAYRTELKPEVAAWGESILAWCLHDLGRDAEAAETYLRLSQTATLSEETRARNALAGAVLLKKTAPDEALVHLDRAAAWRTSVQGSVYAEIVHVLLEQDKLPVVRTRLSDLLQARPDAAEELLLRIVQDSANWSAPEDEAHQSVLFSLLGELRPQSGNSLQTAMAQAKSARLAGRAMKQLQEKAVQAFADPALAAWRDSTKAKGLKSDDDFDQAIKAAEQKGDGDRRLYLAVQALLASTTDTTFSRRLFQVAAAIEWQERAAGKPADERFATAIFELIDEVPKDDAVSQVGRLIHAEHLTLKRDFRGAQAICETVLGEPELMERFRPIAYNLLGSNQESADDYEKAAVTYAKLEKYAPQSPDYCGLLLHSIFLNLHLSHNAEAVRLIQVLASIDPNIVGQAPGAEQIQQFIVLYRSGKAEDYWKRWHLWWHSWEALAKTVALPPAAEETAVPIIANSQALGVLLRPSLQAGDRKQFFQELRRAVSALRWLPESASPLAECSTLVRKIAPELTVAYRDLLIDWLEQAQDELGNPNERRNRKLMLAANSADAGRQGIALGIIEELQPSAQLGDPFTIRLHWVWGMTALMATTQRIESAAALETDLANPIPTEQRPGLVTLLADLYASLHDYDDEVKLLSREVEHPDIKGDPEAGPRLMARYEKLKGPSLLQQSAELRRAPLALHFNVEGKTQDAPVKVLYQLAPDYPSRLRKKKVQGTVVVEFTVDASGSIVDAHAISAPDPGLAEVSIAALLNWRFEPARKNGAAISTRMQVPFEFAADK